MIEMKDESTAVAPDQLKLPESVERLLRNQPLHNLGAENSIESDGTIYSGKDTIKSEEVRL